jgi:hypothetical protein
MTTSRRRYRGPASRAVGANRPSVFEVRERHEGYSLCPALELHFLKLPKRANPANELERRAVLNWCQFLSARTDEELEELAMTDPTFH